ncbi:hypothetical protein Tco_0251788 [Tanacetum coccineum]
MGTIDSVKSILTQSALDALYEKFYIRDAVHPELPGRNDRIHNSPTGKIGVYSRTLLMLFGISRYYDLDENCYPTFWANDDEGGCSFACVLWSILFFVPELLLLYAEMDLFAFINHVDPTKVRIGEREVTEGVVPLLQLTRVRVVPFASVNDQGDVNVQGAGDDDVNEGDADAAEANQTERGEHVVDVGGIDVVANDEVQAIVADKPQRVRKKKKAAAGASGSGLPPKKLREYHGTSGIGANTGGKYLAALQSLLEGSTLLRLALWPQLLFSMPPPPVLTAAVATTIIAGATSALIHKSDLAGPSQPVGIELSARSFYVSQDMDPKTLQQIYIPKLNVINDSVLDDPDVCRGMIDHLAPPGFFSQLRGMDYEQLLAEFNVGTARQVCFSAEIRFRLEHKLREAEAAEAIRLCGQVAVVEAAEAARASELNGLKEQNEVLKGQATTLESATISKDAELASSNAQVAKVTQDLSNLTVVSALETTCSDLHTKVIGYKLFKEQIEAVQDVQVKVFSDRVADLDAELMRMDLHLDEEFYPRYLTTIAGRKWILSRGLILVVMKFLQSPEYLAALGGVIGRAIDKGIQDGLAAGIDHGKAGRVLTEIAAYDPATEANYVAVVNALCAVDFPFLAQLASHKDSSMSDLMDLLRLEGPAAKTSEAKQLQPSPDQLMLPIHRLEDQVVIGETSLSFSLDLAYARVWKLKESDASRQLSIFDALVPIVKPLSVENLIGEANTLGVPAAVATTTALSTNFVEAGSVSPIPHAETSPSSIVFEKEELDTTPEHTSASAKLPALFCMDGLIAPVHEISRLISKASSFCTMSTSAFLMVGMPISTGITAYVPYGLEVGSIRRIQGIGYGVLEFLGIRRIELVSFVVFGECRNGYTVSSLMDMAYWSSE